MSARRLGVLGGTFDPIHYGHLDAGDAAQRALQLDEIRVIPSHDPPHRPVDPRASAFHRFALAALAVVERPQWRLSDSELQRSGPSYSIDTLRQLHAEGWQAAQIFFILGADAFAEIATWHQYPAVLDASRFAVVARPGVMLQAATASVAGLGDRVGSSIFLVEADTRDVSSTAIRGRLASGLPITGLVPAAVEHYIQTHQLYGAVGDLHGENERIHR
jgi:nicotinate-nucleotide adenylyltransferase